MPFHPVRYMEWAKSVPATARYRLTMSGMAPPPSDLLAPECPAPAALLSWGEEGYTARGLSAAIGSAFGMPEEGVLVTGGTSEANFVAVAAAAEAGHSIAVETPAYEPLIRVADALGVRVLRVPRRPETGFAPDRDAVDRALAAGARAVFLSRLHNPSGRDLPAGTLEALHQACADRGAVLLVDEVYLDFAGAAGGTAAAALGEHAVTTSSLTKVQGLGALRIGWILGSAGFIRRCRVVRDHLEVVQAGPSIWFAVEAFRRRRALVDRACGVAARGRAIFDRWLRDFPGLEFSAPDGGLCGVLRLPGGVEDGAFAERLLARAGTGVVPGHFFELPGWIRVGWGADTPDLVEGLDRLGEALRRA